MRECFYLLQGLSFYKWGNWDPVWTHAGQSHSSLVILKLKPRFLGSWLMFPLLCQAVFPSAIAWVEFCVFDPQMCSSITFRASYDFIFLLDVFLNCLLPLTSQVSKCWGLEKYPWFILSMHDRWLLRPFLFAVKDIWDLIKKNGIGEATRAISW